MPGSVPDSLGLARRHRAAQRLANQLVRMDGQDAPKTAACLHQLPAGAIGVGFELINADTTREVTYNAAFALSAGVNDWFSPLDAKGHIDNTGWMPVTRNGETAITVPAAESPACPARVLTDTMPFLAPPPPRLDGGAGICLFFRQCTVTHTGTVRVFDQSVPRWSGHLNGQHPGQFSQTHGGGWALPGNHCVPGRYALLHDPNGLGPFSVPNAVIPLLSRPVLGVMSVGDSILSGVASQEAVDMGIAGMGFWLTRRLDATPWMGCRPCLPDMLPVIGRGARHKGLWFNFGHQHHGLTLGPVTGRLLAEMLTGEVPFTDPLPYGAERFG